MLRIIFIAFLIYLAYKVIFQLVIPVYRTTRQVKKGMREMQEKMNQHMQQQQGGTNGTAQGPATSSPHSDKKEKVGDYIDFEEIK